MSVRIFRGVLALAIALGGAALSVHGDAQASKLPPEVQQALALVAPKLPSDMGKRSGITGAVFTPLLKPEDSTGVSVAKNIAYGADPLQILDLYRPTGHVNAPVVVFIHGGAYVGGDKDMGGGIYANVPIWFARHGFLAINADYRLAPAAKWPAATDDIGTIVTWAKANAGTYGGDPNRIFLVGHSAGATHVANYVFNPALQPKGGSGVAGAVLISGRYQLDPHSKDLNAANMREYFGSDPALYPDRSAINHVSQSRVPVFIVMAEFENPTLDVSAAELLAAECEHNGSCPRFDRLEHHNHMSEIAAFSNRDEGLGNDILDFMAQGH